MDLGFDEGGLQVAQNPRIDGESVCIGYDLGAAEDGALLGGTRDIRDVLHTVGDGGSFVDGQRTGKSQGGTG